MPIPELQDYITLINQEAEKEKSTVTTSQKEEKQKTFTDLFRNGNPLTK